jgi:hypothetical protein
MSWPIGGHPPPPHKSIRSPCAMAEVGIDISGG